jgi:hypothetical protein
MIKLIIRGCVGLVLTLGCSLVGLAQEPNAASATGKTAKYLKLKYDKQKNQTTVALKRMSLSSAMAKEVTNVSEVAQLDLDGSFEYPGQQLSQAAEAVTLNFRALSKFPVYQRGQNVVGVLDGDQALMLGATSYKSISQTFMMEEVLSISIPYTALKRMAESKSLRIFLGTREIKFREKDQEALRELVSFMTP